VRYRVLSKLSLFIESRRKRIVPTILAVLCISMPVAVFLIASPTSSAAAPSPDPVSRRWQLDIKPGPLRLKILNVDGVGMRAFFYFTYFVQNNTGKDLLFAPSFELATEDGKLVRSGRGVPSAVTKTLLTQLRNPFLLDQIGAVGLLLQGEENAREGLIVWQADNLEVDEVTIFASGFSGETTTYNRPDTGEPVLLRKTLMLRHATPGDIAVLGDRPLSRVQQRWIMR
jgi:hypothetical protein